MLDHKGLQRLEDAGGQEMKVLSRRTARKEEKFMLSFKATVRTF